MIRILQRFLAAATVVLAAFPASAADLQIFTAPNFGGTEITLLGETPDVAGFEQHFNSLAASLVVNDRWEVCTEANFAGDCVIIGPGRYPTLAAPIHRRIGSVRPLAVKQAEDARNRPPSIPRTAPVPPPVARNDWREPPPRERARFVRGAVDLFPGAEYRGRAFQVDRDEPELEDFTDRVASLVIHEGVWELCPQPGYRGRCRTLEPGRYPTLRGAVQSLRQVR